MYVCICVNFSPIILLWYIILYYSAAVSELELEKIESAKIEKQKINAVADLRFARTDKLRLSHEKSSLDDKLAFSKPRNLRMRRRSKQTILTTQMNNPQDLPTLRGEALCNPQLPLNVFDLSPRPRTTATNQDFTKPEYK